MQRGHGHAWVDKAVTGEGVHGSEGGGGEGAKPSVILIACRTHVWLLETLMECREWFLMFWGALTSSS